jgi:uncharacterized Fe-S cluster protein YjdI/CDGSH-type Zn-finger protein
VSAPRGRAYRGERITVSFEARRCIHVGACLRGLPAVFETGRKPWIVVGDADAATVAAVVERCPSGALTYERHDGGPAEVAEGPTRIERGARGPLHVRGDVVVRTADGEVRLTRATLCACGRTANPPFCDLSHRSG